MNIIVLCGGTSSERDVSIASSEKIAKALKENGHSIALTDVFLGSPLEIKPSRDFNVETEAERLRKYSKSLTEEMKEKKPFFGPHVLEACKRADLVFLGLHGKNGEDGKIQAAFDLLKIKYTGSGYLGSCTAMNKSLTKDVAGKYISMPRGIILNRGWNEECSFQVPCVVKPGNGGSSLGVSIVKKEADLKKAVREAFSYDDTVVVEEYIKGKELTQSVLNGEVLPPIEIRPPRDGEYDYENKYNGLTQEICPAPLEASVLKKMSSYSVLMGKILGLSVYYRIDYILSEEGKLYCLEANTLPGMTEFSLLPRAAREAGISYNELCEKIVRFSMEKYD